MRKDYRRAVIMNVWWRTVPLLALALLMNYLDKVNIGFAALQMNKSLGLSNSLYGFGAGFFAVGYTVFGIPSVLMLRKLGARRWITVMMVAWGMFSAATAFITRPSELLVLRLLLGAAEAGFLPGVIFYFGQWFPSAYRGKVFGSFQAIAPLGLVIGGPVSAILLTHDGAWGLGGWQWLFVIEALPTLVLAVLIFIFLTERPLDARWLTESERNGLTQLISSEEQHVRRVGGAASVRRALTNSQVWRLAVVFFGIGTSGIGAVFFLPLIIRSMGFSIWNTGFLAAVPAAAAAVMLPLWGLWADHARRPESVVAAACCAIVLGLLGTAVSLPSPWALVAVSIAMIGFYESLAAFWKLPTRFLSGDGAATGMALISIAGNMGGLVGPAVLGWATDRSHAYMLGLGCLACIALGSALVASPPGRGGSATRRCR